MEGDQALSFLNIMLCRLLDVLADRKAKKGLSGHVLINGKRQPYNFKCASAYVVQVSHKITHTHTHNDIYSSTNLQIVS